MNKYTAEERKAAKRFLDDVETQLNHSQDMHSLNMAYGKTPGMTEAAWQEAIDADGRHLSEQWQMLRDMRKQFGVK